MAGPNVIEDLGDSLVELLRRGLEGIVDSDNVYLANADDLANVDYVDAAVATVFLYRVAINSEMRNGPRRTLADGQITRPLLPIDLHFMVTAWARDTGDEYRIAGRILQLMYDNAELGPAQLRGEAWAPDDSVQIILESLPVDDHYRIWDSSNSPYRLSLTYLVRVIGIEPAESTRVSRVLGADIRRLRSE